jgi:hypothetical protein
MLLLLVVKGEEIAAVEEERGPEMVCGGNLCSRGKDLMR